MMQNDENGVIAVKATEERPLPASQVTNRWVPDASADGERRIRPARFGLNGRSEMQRPQGLQSDVDDER